MSAEAVFLGAFGVVPFIYLWGVPLLLILKYLILLVVLFSITYC